MRRLSVQVSVGFQDVLTDEQRGRIWAEVRTIGDRDVVPPAIDWSTDTSAAVITVGLLSDGQPPYDLAGVKGQVDRAVRAVLNTPQGLRVKYTIGRADVLTDLGVWPVD